MNTARLSVRIKSQVTVVIIYYVRSEESLSHTSEKVAELVCGGVLNFDSIEDSVIDNKDTIGMFRCLILIWL